MFIGQDKIVNELNIMLPFIKDGENISVLFRAPSGHGKTTLALIMLKYLGINNSFLYIPEETTISIQENKRFHFIDEIHLLKNPEILYPYMDSKNYTFILASNESGTLKEPLVNRSIQYIFEPYTRDQLIKMASHLIKNIGVGFCELLVDRCRGNPRVLKNICRRLDFYMRSGYEINSENELDNLLSDVLEIKKDGITNLELTYLDYLRKVGGRASLLQIVSGIRLDESTIKREIEPLLLYLGKITISSRGREIINDNN